MPAGIPGGAASAAWPGGATPWSSWPFWPSLATVFALGYASGCSAHQTDDEVKTPEPVVTAETVTPPAPEQSPVEPSAPPEETTEPARHRDDIVSEGRLLSYELQEVMQDCCEHYEVPYALALAIAED